jgi:hypothetical protein
MNTIEFAMSLMYFILPDKPIKRRMTGTNLVSGVQGLRYTQHVYVLHVIARQTLIFMI